MNKSRRNKVKKLLSILADVRGELEVIIDEEAIAADNCTNNEMYNNGQNTVKSLNSSHHNLFDVEESIFKATWGDDKEYNGSRLMSCRHKR